MKYMCQGLVPRAPWAAGYDTKNLDTTRLSPVANGWGVTHLVPGIVPPLLAKEEEPLT
jgi:hypothetical protein